MKLKHDAIVVLSNTLTPQRELSSESIVRMDRGIELFQNNLAGLLVMNGGPGCFTEKTAEGIRVPRGTHPVHAEVMRDYALNQGIPESYIEIQDFSSDTVGEAHFLNGMVLHHQGRDRGLHNLLIVTSRYHIKRCEPVYRLALGSTFTLTFDDAVRVPHEQDPHVLANEKSSLELFHRQFEGIKPGDFSAFEKMLYERHEIYSQIPEHQRLRCFT